MTQTIAQDINLSSIENTINLYFDGMINHNSASIKKAFAPTASMKWVEKGEYKEVNAAEARKGNTADNGHGNKGDE